MGLSIVCVKAGQKYGPEYVNILHDMVRRNLLEGTEGKFICFTDDPSGLNPGIEAREIPDGIGGWWAKLTLFKPNVFEPGERIVYFDLDVVITGALDELVTYSGDFAILKEFYNTEGWQSSMMAWRAGYGHEIWERWIDEGKPNIPGGDQEWIELVLGKADYLQDLFPNSFYSYKIHLFHKIPPRSCKVVVFHGEPKPDNCGDEWVSLIWKIGGGSSAELALVCNTKDELLKANISHSTKLQLEWLQQQDAHEGHAVIVGGGPSLRPSLDEIRWRQNLGQKIFATNNTHRFLLEHGIKPDAHVFLDAREENTEFIVEDSDVVYYVASQCSPKMFEKLSGKKVMLWHSNCSVLDEAINNPEQKNELLISGGTTVGLSAMVIAFALGYRQIHLYGMDSSLSEEQHHAYNQRLNDNDTILDVVCHWRNFRAAAWMVAQVDQFQEIAYQLANMDCVITAHGDGLLPWVAKHLANDMQAVDGIEQEDNGLWWPKADRIAKSFILSNVSDLERIVTFCDKKDLIVMAGGNVGVYPKAAAKHFKQVVTFEPDKLNYECLKLNCDESNILAYNTAIGEKCETKGLLRHLSNCGAHMISESGNDCEVITIDSLNLPACDLIMLDIEGYEYFALKGAEKTIRQFYPVISVELKQLGKEYGIDDIEILKFLTELGYQKAMRVGRDVVFTTNVKEQYKWKRCTTGMSQGQMVSQ